MAAHCDLACLFCAAPCLGLAAISCCLTCAFALVASFCRDLCEVPFRDTLKPLDIVQPEGASWTVSLACQVLALDGCVTWLAAG